MLDFIQVDIRVIILALTATLNFVLGVFLYLSSKLKSSRFFVILVFAVTIWSIGINVATQGPLSNLTYIWADINIISTSIIVPAFFFFSYYFTTERAILNKKIIYMIGSAFALIVLLVFGLGTEGEGMISKITEVNGIKIEQHNWSFAVYAIYILTITSAAIAMLIKKLRRGVGSVKNQVKYILIGTGFGASFGVSGAVILPSFGQYTLIWLGPVGAFIMIPIISYAITKHNLWNFRILAVQFFVVLIIITLLLNMFVAENATERVIKGGIFVIVLLFSYYLIRDILHEVGARERMEKLAKDLSLANAHLASIDEEKSDFVSITSHQFRTPLTIIKGYTSMLLEGAFGNIENISQKNTIQKIYKASERLVYIIEEFMDISKIEKNEMIFYFKKVDLKLLLSEIIRDFSSIIDDVGLSLEFHSDGKDSFYIKADENKIKLVLHNILDNAIKYTPHGGKIRVLLGRSDGYDKKILITVVDTGIGIQKGTKQKLFEKFSREFGISKLHTEGRGLGLFISKQIVVAHGGRIWAESSGKNRGSTFYLEFPDWNEEQKGKNVPTAVFNYIDNDSAVLA